MTLRIENLHVRNYRALKDVTLEKITPLTVLLGPNGSGKSTVFDVFAFLSECFSGGLRKAWDRRGRFRELRSREMQGPIEIEMQYREKPDAPLITYHLEIEEQTNGPVVKREFMRWEQGNPTSPFYFLDYRYGQGKVATTNTQKLSGMPIEKNLSGSDVLAVNTLGFFAENSKVATLRTFITDWHLSCLSADAMRSNHETGAQERLSPTGNNLPNVVHYLAEQHPEQLKDILRMLRQRIPRIEKVETKVLPDSRLLLLVKDAAFSTPMLSRFASDGTLMMLAYLTLLNQETPPQLIGIEKPESHLHHRLLPELAEECQQAAERTQLIVSTHSPSFINSLRPEEVRVLYRGMDGYTRVSRVSDMPDVPALIQQGASLGELWMDGYFEAGDQHDAASTACFSP